MEAKPDEADHDGGFAPKPPLKAAHDGGSAPKPPLEAAWRSTLRRGVYFALALSVAATAGLVFLGGGLGEVFAAFARLPWIYVTLALVGVTLEWAADTARFAVAGRAIGVSLPARFWLEVALVNLSAAYVANVGPPVAAYVMNKRGVPAGDALAVTVGKHLLFFPSALLPTWLLLLLSRDRVGGAALFGTLTVMVVLSVAMIAAMLSVALFPKNAERLADRIPYARRSKAVLGFIAGITRFFRGRPRFLVGSLVTALLNQAALVAMIAVLFRGFGGDALAPGLLGRCYLFSTLSQISPTPGGAGLSEAGGVLVFRGLLGDAELAALLVLARFFCAGLPILAGGLLLARTLRAPSTNAGAAS